MLVGNWKEVLLKSWSVRAAGLGVVLPEVLDFLANNIEFLNGIGLSDHQASIVRAACLLAVLILRPVKQKSLPG